MFESTGTFTWYAAKVTLNAAVSYTNETLATKNITMYVKTGLSDTISLREK